MALYKGNTKIKSLYLGNTKIKKLYKGSTLVYSSGGYPSGTVLFENATAGTYTLKVEYDCTVSVDLVGGGSGGCYFPYLKIKGGSGAYISGTTTITAGTYSIEVGAGSEGVNNRNYTTVSAGGNSTFNGNTAGGAGSWTPYRGKSTGGTATVVSSGLSGQNGSGQNSTGWISGYGAGGNTTDDQAATIKGKDGYCKITVV